jgi:hypothetical protein
MTVRREDEWDIEPFALRVALGLFQAVPRGQRFLLGLDQGDRDWLCVLVDGFAAKRQFVMRFIRNRLRLAAVYSNRDRDA